MNTDIINRISELEARLSTLESLLLRKKAEPKKARVYPIVFDWDTARFTGILPEQITKWQEVYDNIDVKRTIQEIETWVMSNPNNAKSNWGRFINTWLSTNSKRSPRRVIPITPPVRKAVMDTIDEAKPLTQEQLSSLLGFIREVPDEDL